MNISSSTPSTNTSTPSCKATGLSTASISPIEPVDDRLPSEVLGLHLEADWHLRPPVRPGQPASDCSTGWNGLN